MSSTKTQETKMPEWQEDFIRENILPLGVDIAGQDYTPYEGDMVAGMSPLQRQSLRDYRGIDTGGEVYGQAIGAQQGLTGFSPGSMSAQGQIGVDKLASTDLGAYMSPYTQNVIDRSLQTLGGAQSQALNQMDASATAAKAFGGSRHGIAEAGTREGYAKQAGDLVSGLQERAFTQALQSAQFDIGNVQQAREAAAARAQAANAANYQGQFEAAGIQSAAANAMAGLAGQRLSSQLSGLGAQMSAGEQQRALRQAQLQADYAMFEKEQGHPLMQLNALLSAGSGVPAGLGTVTSHDPFGGLTAVGNLLSGAGSAGKGYEAYMGTSDMRLKQNIAPAGSEGGVNFYTWDWNEEGKKVAYEGQPTFGVMAQELEVTHPDLVVIGEDGYRRVKYDELYKRIGR